MADEKKKFPRKGSGIPRRDIDITPEERLYDPDKILGSRDTRAKIEPTKKTIVSRPRLESTEMIETTQKVRPIAPKSELPFRRRQAHLDLSRDAEVLYVNECVEVDEATRDEYGNIVPVQTELFCFDTWQYTRTLIREVSWTIKDGLEPPGLTLGFQVDGEVVKYLADPRRAAWPGAGYAPERTVVTPTSIDIDHIPTGFHNVLLEVDDKKNVCIFITNSIPAVRFVCVHIWGWIESQTRMGEQVWH
jgi:hypothetical protein